MQGNKKRVGSHTGSSKKSSKKIRFQTIEHSTAPSAAAESSTTREVPVHNFVYQASGHGRLNHKTTHHLVAPHPAEGIFSKLPARGADDMDPASLLEAFPMEEDSQSAEQLAQDSDAANKKKRVRSDLKAAVRAHIYNSVLSDSGIV